MIVPDPDQIEPRFREAIGRWVEGGIPPGDFLQAVLLNDLRSACAMGDPWSLANLPHIVAYLWNRAPAGCWGSKENCQAWLEHVARVRAGGPS